MATNNTLQQNALEAERSIIGACLLDPESAAAAVDLIEPRDFQEAKHRTVFVAVREILQNGGVPDLVTVYPKAASQSIDASWLSALTDNTHSGPTHVQQWAHIVKDAASRRKLIVAGKRLASEAMSPAVNIAFLLDQHKEALKAVVNDAGRQARSIYAVSQLSTDIAQLEINIEYAVDGLIPENMITLFYAPGGLGKSTLAAQMAQAITDGVPFLGLSTKKAPVVYLDYENPDSTLVSRLRKIGGKSPYRVWRSNSDPSPPPLDDPARRDELLSLEPGTVLFIDTLKATNDADENSAREMKPIFDQLKRVRNLGVTIVLLHHTNKGPDGVYRGSSVIVDQSDHCLSLQKVKAPGSDVEASDDDEVCTYRLGVKGKTRAKPFKTFVEFDLNTELFRVADDPDVEHIAEIARAIYTLENDGKVATQSAIISFLSRGEGKMISNQRIMSLLKKRVGIEWFLSKGANNASVFSLTGLPVFGFSPLI